MDFTVQRNRYLSTKTNFVPRIHSDVFYFCIFASVRVTRTSKARQTVTIRTVANSLPENGIFLLTLLILKRYIPYTDLRKNFAFEAGLLSVPFARLVMARFAADQLGEDFKLCDCDVPIFIIFEFFVR